MAGPPKNRASGRQDRAPSTAAGSSSGQTSSSSSGHAAQSVRSSNSHASRPVGAGFDGSADPSPPTTGRNPNTAAHTVHPDTKMNFDLGMAGWSTIRSVDVASTLPARQPASKLGVPAKVGLNVYHVEQFPNIPVHQYDVMIGNGAEKRGLIKKVWESQAVRKEMDQFTIYDGNKLAWSGKAITREVKIIVDLDAEEGRQVKEGARPNVHRVVIRQTNTVGFQQLMAHLQGKTSFDNTCLEAINFADHLLRMTPSTKYTAIKRSFFAKGQRRFNLGGGVEAFKGVYQSLRLVHPGRLAVNLDVANGTFWSANRLHLSAVQVCGARDVSDLSGLLSRGEASRAGQQLKRMKKVRVFASHRGNDTVDEYCIERFIYKSSKTYPIQVKDSDGQDTEMTLYAFFLKKYNIRLQYSELPLCKMTKGKNTVLPMEILTIKENQRYAYKMDEKQTSEMIKFAVTAPPERYQAIQHGIDMLNWAQDPILNKYGVRITTTRTSADGRVLPAPTVKFGAGEAKPGTSGRWDLKGKKFLTTNSAPLKSWAVCVITGRRGGKPDKSTIQKFLAAFVSGYIAHGGKVENKQPILSLSAGDDVGKWVTDTWNLAGNQTVSRPQILLFILPDKDSQVYGRIKRSCECRYGVVSQCIQYAQAVKCAPQYISNVCMKFNSKLGGVTCRAIGPKSGGPTGCFTIPTMIIGADVSHSAPGVQTPSMAAITVSTDKLATRYAAVVQTNGYRVEMINTDIILNELKPLVQHWIQNVGGGRVPAQVIYLRDGVSEGQYQHVLQQEVNDMKQLLKGADPAASPKFVVVVGSKRHHVRFFPERGDRNGNPFPGTLVETGVTNPFENDFYLCSHAAIKGTARPAHYYVLANESKMTNDQLHTLLYEQVYQYARASTPISQHPAIYYAHLAAARAGPHDPKWAGSSDVQTETAQKKVASQTAKSSTHNSSTQTPTEFDKLLPMPNHGLIATSMWYI